MPILRVTVPDAGADDGGALAQRIADAAGAVFDSRPNGTWVFVERMAAADYAENGAPLPSGPPVFATILMARLPEAEGLAQLAQKLTAAISAACGRAEEHVHLLFEPAGQGRIFFGGAGRG